MNLNNDIDKIMNNMELTKKVFQCFKILKHGYKFHYTISFEDSGNELYIIDEYINKYNNIDRFVFLSNTDLNEENNFMVVRYGIGRIVENMVIKVINQVGLKYEIESIGKIKVYL